MLAVPHAVAERENHFVFANSLHASLISRIVFARSASHCLAEHHVIPRFDHQINSRFFTDYFGSARNHERIFYDFRNDFRQYFFVCVLRPDDQRYVHSATLAVHHSLAANDVVIRQFVHDKRFAAGIEGYGFFDVRCHVFQNFGRAAHLFCKHQATIVHLGVELGSLAETDGFVVHHRHERIDLLAPAGDKRRHIHYGTSALLKNCRNKILQNNRRVRIKRGKALFGLRAFCAEVQRHVLADFFDAFLKRRNLRHLLRNEIAHILEYSRDGVKSFGNVRSVFVDELFTAHSVGCGFGEG